MELHPRLVTLLGRCKFRFHHGQNLLQHAQEVALLAGFMAEEMGARADVARRAGLLHEIGRAEESIAGSTLEIAADLVSKFGESEDVSHAIRALENGVDPRIPEGLLLRAANRISENRPGRETYKPKVEVPKDAYPLLQSLKESGYVLGMVSNREYSFREEMQREKLDCYFRFFLAGGEVNSFKPDALIFERALELAGTSSGETMYIGDNYFADIVGSRRAGLMPVLYDPVLLFPEADCAVIRSFAELLKLLG